jgi:hypothetical protein
VGASDPTNEAKAAAAAAPEASSAPLTPAERRSHRRAERLARIAAARATAAAHTPSGASSNEERPHRRASAPVEGAAATTESSEAATSDGRGTNFDRSAAQIALEGAATQAKNCRPLGGPSGSGVVQVQYEPSGKVSSAVITTAGFENTSAASCITMLFRRARIAPFNGSKSVTMKQRFEIP